MKLSNIRSLAARSSVYLVLSLVGIGTAHAQEESDGGSLVLEEIVVTAQRRGEQSLLEVPISVSVISEANITDGSFGNLDELAFAVTGFTAVSSDGVPGARQMQVRGVSADTGQAATVGYYWDEAPVNLGRNSAPYATTLDVKRVEVLRGPQGTAFGEGSMGGTIRVISNKPDLSTFSGRITGGASEYEKGGNSWGGSIVLNAPLAEDVFGIRVAAKYDDRSGFIDNPLRDERNINSGEQSQIRVNALLVPTDKASVQFTYFQDRNDYNGRAVATDIDAYTFSSLGQEKGRADVDFYNLTFELELGIGDLLGSTTYIESDQFMPRNIDGGPAAFFGSATNQEIDNTSTSTEIRLNSNNDGKLLWTIGGIFTSIENQSLTDQYSLSLAPTADPTGFLTVLGLAPGFSRTEVSATASLDFKLDSWAAFGELSYQLTDRLTGSLGLRYYDADFKGENESTLGFTITYFDLTFAPIVSPFNPTAINQPPESASPRGSDPDLSPKLSLSYAFSDSTNAYLSAAKGFRAGGVNTILTAPNPIDPLNPFVFPAKYNSESLWTYEAGIKSYLAGSRLYLDAALYQTDWKDIQSSTIPPGASAGYIDNGGEATVSGFDGSLTFLATETLTLGLDLSYTDAKYEFTGLNVNEGDPLPNVPEWGGSASLSWRPALTDRLSGVAHLVYSYQDESFRVFRSFAAAGLDPVQEMQAVSIANLRLGVEGERLGAYLYLTNLLDERGLSSPADVNIAAVLGAAVLVPRTVGAEFTYNF